MSHQVTSFPIYNATNKSVATIPPVLGKKDRRNKEQVIVGAVTDITSMQQQRRELAWELDQRLKSKKGTCLTNDGSALSVNITGLERQDAALLEAVTEGNYVTGIIGWYPASQNANRGTNANVTTRSFKSHLKELIGDDRNVLVYWVDCWQFCHKSRNRSMRYNHIKKFVSKDIEIQRMCADLLAINIAIAESICGHTIPWVLNGVGETLSTLRSIFPLTPINEEAFTTRSDAINIHSDHTISVRELYARANGNLEMAIETVKRRSGVDE
jgi:hypothetical protein